MPPRSLSGVDIILWIWSGQEGIWVIWVSGRKRRCCHPWDSAALQLCLSVRVTVVDILKSINGLNWDEATACIDVSLCPTLGYAGEAWGSGGGWLWWRGSASLLWSIRIVTLIASYVGVPSFSFKLIIKRHLKPTRKPIHTEQLWAKPLESPSWKEPD